MGLFSRRRDDATTDSDESVLGRDLGDDALDEAAASGPWDLSELPEDQEEVPRIDLGALQVPAVDGMQLRMEQGASGWQVVRVANYRAYLEAVQTAAGRDISRYIQATRPIVDRYNGVFRSRQSEFRSLTETGWGTYTTEHRKALLRLLQEDMIPVLKKYQRELDAVEVPPGAAYLAAQRRAATEASIASYESFVRGLDTGMSEDFARAETLHKQALTYDLRVGDMIRRGAVSEETPATP